MNIAAGKLLKNAKLMELDPNEVEDGPSIGFLHEDKAAAIGRLMAVDGQRDPIKVVAQPAGSSKPWRRVVGRHRLHGARLEGIKVWAIEVSGKPEDLADLEASENLHRRPLAPIERAKFTAALVLAAQERIARQTGGLKQHQLAVKARWDKVKSGASRADDALKEEATDTCGNLQRVYGWEQSVSEALEMSRDNIYRDLRFYRLLIEPFPDLIEQLARHPVVGENASQLKLITGVKIESQRRDVIAMLLADREMSADQALVHVGVAKAASSAPVAQHQKFYDQIEGGWSRLGIAQKRDFLPRIAAMLDSDDLKKRLRDMLNSELEQAHATR